MGTTGKVEIALHLDKGLIDQLEKEAKKENKSLNGYVEKMLRKLIRRQPNPETMEAIREARENDNLEVLDVDHFKEFVASLKISKCRQFPFHFSPNDAPTRRNH